MKAAIYCDQAPRAIGPYSIAVHSHNTVYFSGQIPLNPTTMSLISNNFEEQALQVLKNLNAVAEAAGGQLDAIVKLTIYLTNLADFPVLNEVMKRFFREPYPARSTIQVSALPLNAKIEVDAIMALA